MFHRKTIDVPRLSNESELLYIKTIEEGVQVLFKEGKTQAAVLFMNCQQLINNLINRIAVLEAKHGIVTKDKRYV